jgi:hypothetical protein
MTAVTPLVADVSTPAPRTHSADDLSQNSGALRDLTISNDELKRSAATRMKPPRTRSPAFVRGLRGDPSDELPGLAGVGAKKGRRPGVALRLGEGDARGGDLRSADAGYLEKTLRIVPPMTDLEIEVPRGRRESLGGRSGSSRGAGAAPRGSRAPSRGPCKPCR